MIPILHTDALINAQLLDQGLRRHVQTKVMQYLHDAQVLVRSGAVERVGSSGLLDYDWGTFGAVGSWESDGAYVSWVRSNIDWVHTYGAALGFLERPKLGGTGAVGVWLLPDRTLGSGHRAMITWGDWFNDHLYRAMGSGEVIFNDQHYRNIGTLQHAWHRKYKELTRV